MRASLAVLLVVPALLVSCGGSAQHLRNGKIAFVRGFGEGELHVMNPDGSGDRLLARGLQNDYQGPGLEAVGAAWSPDGTRLAFGMSTDSNALATPSWYKPMAIVEVDATGRPAPDPAPQRTRDRDPTWSPDGTRIAFVRSADAFSGEEGIMVARADGSHPRRVMSSGLDPAWSPDGSTIAFVGRWRGRLQIFVMRDDGSRLKRLTTGPDSTDPAWSPDGKHIVFASQRDQLPGALEFQYSLYVMDADGSHVHRLTRGPLDTTPAWSPDGRKIAFARWHKGTSGIVVMDADGSHARLVDWHIQNSDFAPAWQPLRG